MEQVEEFITFKASFELQTFIHENKSCTIANKFEREIDFVLEYCIDKFSQNIYLFVQSKKYKLHHGVKATPQQ